jgi:hypothetical protein
MSSTRRAIVVDIGTTVAVLEVVAVLGAIGAFVVAIGDAVAILVARRAVPARVSPVQPVQRAC